MKKTLFLLLILLFGFPFSAQGAAVQQVEAGQVLQADFKVPSMVRPSAGKPFVVLLRKYPGGKIVKVFRTAIPVKNGEYSFRWAVPATMPAMKLKMELLWAGKKQAISSPLFEIRPKSAPMPVPLPVPTPQALPMPAPVLTNMSDVQVIPAGTQDHFASRYEFRTRLEGWTVRRLTVVNDTQNDGFDADVSEGNAVVSQVILMYQNEAGQTKRVAAPLTNGSATFSGLDFYIPKNDTRSLDIRADIASAAEAGSDFSGRTFRLGLLEANTPQTFEAVGAISSATSNSLSTFQISGSHAILQYVVRDAVIELGVNVPAEKTLINGTNDAYTLTVSTAGSVALGRLVFDVTQNGVESLDQVALFRGSTFLTPGNATSAGAVYLLWDAGATSCFAHTTQIGPGTGMDCAGNAASTGKLIATFSQEEIVVGSQTYTLRFNVNGASQAGDSVAVRLSAGDDAALLSLSGSGGNTGKLHNGGLGSELFTGASDFFIEASALTDRNIVWSDRSADTHLYPATTPGNPPTLNSAGSADFTNGYLLKANALPAFILSR